jgi:hypothetical protein
MVTVHTPTDRNSRADAHGEDIGRSNLLDRTFGRPEGTLSMGAVVALIAGWVGSIAVMEAIAPPSDPSVTLSAWDLTLSLLYTAGIMAGAVGLFARRRFGAVATIGGAGAMVLGSISCWAGGHVGSWILVQFVAGLAMAGASVVALHRS